MQTLFQAGTLAKAFAALNRYVTNVTALTHRPSRVDATLEEPFVHVRVHEDSSPRKQPKRGAKAKAKAKNILRTAPVGPKFLLILLDLNIDNVSVVVSQSKASDPTIWAIHSSGHDETIIRCLDDLSIRVAVRRFFEKQLSNPIESDIGFIHDADQLYNAIYSDTVDME